MLLPDWRPAKLPQPNTIKGHSVRLLAINVERDAESLFEAANGVNADSHQWDYLHCGPFNHIDEMKTWLSTCAESKDPLFFTVIDQQTGLAIGVLSFLAITPEHGSIEIGHVWFSARMQRSTKSTETIYLLAKQAFEELGYRRLEWKCNNLNQRSKEAAHRFGFSAEGLFRQHRVFKGQSRDTAWFSMLDHEWPLQRKVFETWLNPANFDAEGRQKRTMQEIRVNLLSALA
ncbi:GNAT family N-acetyltransferase [Glaciimonas soli]|uniref:GNAT family N-acetyltransferase n=1 Tax=Glaciimonas soli TaxID=2590999 RepID=A0A843YTJ0_9BURK|nr:GNAT family protein [Glaciimonas soli]MQR00661.1 GNAT family N-acetyltransferase [Glaciimonas soli]